MKKGFIGAVSLGVVLVVFIISMIFFTGVVILHFSELKII